MQLSSEVDWYSLVFFLFVFKDNKKVNTKLGMNSGFGQDFRYSRAMLFI